MTNSEPPQIGVAPGDVLAGKYRVERVLGQGGMGVVVAAHHIQLDEKVALKFLLPEGLRNPEAVARFVREARAAVKIKSEHVARVSDVGQLDNGSPYMVMEYLEGGDLAAWLRQRGAMTVEMAVDFVLQACEAIAEAHALGIVHRDLKPANLFCVLRADGQLSVKVLDFGISKVTTPGAQGHDMTNTAAVVGSPMYMSPEQLQSAKGVDTRTDIWSLGVILFELLAGRVPFEAEAVTELVIKIAMSPATPVRSLRPDVPVGLEQVIATCLEKDRERRFASVSELAIALKDFRSLGPDAAAALLAAPEPALAMVRAMRGSPAWHARFEARNEDFIQMLMAVLRNHQWADAQGWSDERKRQETAANIRRALWDRATDADRRLTARGDAAYAKKQRSLREVQAGLIELYERDPKTMPLFRLIQRFNEGANAHVERGQVVDGQPSKGLRKTFLSAFGDWMHLAGGAYCDVFTCDGIVSGWLGDVRERLGLPRQLAVRGYPGGPEAFVRDLMATVP